MALGVFLLPGCGTGDDRASVLKERTRYGVGLQSWADRGDGTLIVTLTITGPAHPKLDRLTVEIRRYGAGERDQGSEWVTLDLSDMTLGAAIERSVTIPSGEDPTESLAVLLHPDPAGEVLPHLRELDGPE